MKSATRVFIVFAGPVEVNQFQNFPIQEVGKEVETANIKVLCTTNRKLRSNGHWCITIQVAISQLIYVAFPQEWELEMFQTTKVTFKVSKGHWYWCQLKKILHGPTRIWTSTSCCHCKAVYRYGPMNMLKDSSIKVLHMPILLSYKLVEDAFLLEAL